MLRLYLRLRSAVRIGIGYDVHRLAEGRPLILGGVRVEHDRGLDGHSDADVLVHAIIDALLGAVALGDIGQHFPDTDAEWKGADSMKLLAHVRGLVRDAGYKVGNVDAVVVLQRPKLRSHIDAMRANLAEVLGIGLGQVSVKATTGETMGFVGREEGAAVHAVCLLLADG
jgi:2-C-methyl-D-erythritol 2,4-cyclodiphosphate synthase